MIKRMKTKISEAEKGSNTHRGLTEKVSPLDFGNAFDILANLYGNEEINGQDDKQNFFLKYLIATLKQPKDYSHKQLNRMQKKTWGQIRHMR